MADEFEQELVFEDIQSVSEKQKIADMASKKSKKGTAAHLDKIVKAISFFVALFVLLVFAVGAFILYKMDKSFAMIALCLLVAGVAFSLIVLFLIYAVGHILTQNNEILKRL